jgi:hypothetical protein
MHVHLVEPGPTGGPGALGALLAVGILRDLGHTVEHAKFQRVRGSQQLSLTPSTRKPDAVFVSCIYVRQWAHLALLFRRMDIPLWAHERGPEHPLVVFGGQAMSTPEPIAPFADVIAYGDGEATIPLLMALLEQGKWYAELGNSKSAGLYFPMWEGPPVPVWRAEVAQIPTRLVQRSRRSKPTIELARGCKSKCAFCSIGWGGGTYREADKGAVLEVVRQHAGKPLNLFAPDFASVSYVDEVDQWLGAHGCRQGGRDARVDVAVRKGMVRDISFGIDAPSERLRKAVGKAIPHDVIVSAMESLEAGGVKHAKLMVVIGYPGETFVDRAEFYVLLNDIARVYTGMLDITISLLDPNPHTPLQWSDGHWHENAWSWATMVQEEIHARWGAGELQWKVSSPKAKERYEHEIALRRAGREAAAYLAGCQVARSWVGEGRWRDSWVGPVPMLGELEVGKVYPWSHVKTGMDEGSVVRAWQAYRRRAGV